MEININQIDFKINSYLTENFEISFQTGNKKFYNFEILMMYSYFFEKILNHHFQEKNIKKCDLPTDNHTFDIFYNMIMGRKVFIKNLQINNLLYFLDYIQVKKKLLKEFELQFVKNINNENLKVINLDFIQTRYYMVFNKIVKYILEKSYLKSVIINHDIKYNKNIELFVTDNYGINESTNNSKIKISCKPEYIFCSQKIYFSFGKTFCNIFFSQRKHRFLFAKY